MVAGTPSRIPLPASNMGATRASRRLWDLMSPDRKGSRATHSYFRQATAVSFFYTGAFARGPEFVVETTYAAEGPPRDGRVGGRGGSARGLRRRAGKLQQEAQPGPWRSGRRRARGQPACGSPPQPNPRGRPPRDALGAPPRSGRHRKPVGQNGPPFCPTGRVTRSATSYGLMAGVEGVPATTADGLLPYTASTLNVYSVFSLSPDTTALTS